MKKFKELRSGVVSEGAEKYTVKKGNMTRKVDGATADKMKRQGWKLIATEGLDEAKMDKPLEKQIGMGDSRSEKEIRDQISGLSAVTLKKWASKPAGRFGSKIAKLQDKLVAAEMKKRGLKESDNRIMGSPEFIHDKRTAALKEAEDNMPASPDEAGMAMDQAKFIGYVAKEIQEYIQGNNEFPEWMQNKLSALHEKAKGMHAVMAGKYNESVELDEVVYRKGDTVLFYSGEMKNNKPVEDKGTVVDSNKKQTKVKVGSKVHTIDNEKIRGAVDESLRSDIAKLSAKFPEGSKVKMKHDGKVATVLSVGKDFIKVGVGSKTMDHKPDELVPVKESDVEESSASWAKSLETIAKKKQLDKISDKDKELLIKLADMMKNANK